MLKNKFINRLLNWLYAFVMLMPILSILYLCFYGVLNPNSALDGNLLENTFFVACDKVLDMSLFNWALSSFLIQPIDIFLNLFGVPSNSIYDLLLCYWLSVSLAFIGFEILMWFITFVRSLINDLNIGDGLL